MEDVYDLIKKGSDLTKEIAEKTKELNELKNKLRTYCKEEEMAEVYGDGAIVTAKKHTATTVKTTAVFDEILGIDSSKIEGDSIYQISGDKLELMLLTANYTIKTLSKAFPDEKIRSELVTEKVTPFHVISFKPLG